MARKPTHQDGNEGTDSESGRLPWAGPVATADIAYEPCVVTFINVLGFASADEIESSEAIYSRIVLDLSVYEAGVPAVS
jgi:hypothetical protein